MQSINATFPKDLKPEQYIFMLTDALKITNNPNSCQIEFLGDHKGEYLFKIRAKEARHFYLLGMTASQIIRTLEDVKKSMPPPILNDRPKTKTIYFKDN